MPEYIFMTGEKFSVYANDEHHAKQVIDAYFDGEWENDPYVEEEDIETVQYVGADTILLKQGEPGKMKHYYTYEE
jgi:hypothetical protein